MEQFLDGYIYSIYQRWEWEFFGYIKKTQVLRYLSEETVLWNEWRIKWWKTIQRVKVESWSQTYIWSQLFKKVGEYSEWGWEVDPLGTSDQRPSEGRCPNTLKLWSSQKAAGLLHIHLSLSLVPDSPAPGAPASSSLISQGCRPRSSREAMLGSATDMPLERERSGSWSCRYYPRIHLLPQNQDQSPYKNGQNKKRMARWNLKVFGRTVKRNLSISNYALYGTRNKK